MTETETQIQDRRITTERARTMVGKVTLRKGRDMKAEECREMGGLFKMRTEGAQRKSEGDNK